MGKNMILKKPKRIRDEWEKEKIENLALGSDYIYGLLTRI